MNANSPENKTSEQAELQKQRFDYAWKWFDYHARQRIQMFNFFLVGMGLVFKMFTDSQAEREKLIIAISGGFLSLVFLFLDKRNEALVHYAEDILLKLEQEELFPENYKGKRKNSKDRSEVQLGFMNRESRRNGVYTASH
jgi:hypothetical protein